MKKQLKQTLIVSALAAGLTAGTAALAQDAGWYIGAGVGQSDFDAGAGDLNRAIREAGGTPSRSSVDDTDTGWKIFGGYQFNKYFAVEGAYIDLGEQEFRSNITAPVSGRLSGDVRMKEGFYLDAVGILPITNEFSVFGKLGAYTMKTEAKASLAGFSFSESDRNEDLTFGVGANYYFTKNFGVRAEWERFNDVGDARKTVEQDIDLFSVGVQWKF